MRSLEVRKVEDDFDITRLRTFMLEQPQYYPDYGDWVDGKAIPRIESGRAEGLIVISDGVVVGNAVYQSLENDSKTIELKNFRIDEHYRNVELGRFMLRQAQDEGAAMLGLETGSSRIVTDVSTLNFSGVEFFLRNGFHITGVDDLYVPGQNEYLLQR